MTAANFTQATSLTAINKGIKAVATTAAKLNQTIHDVAVMCMVHAQNFGDCTAAARLVDALPKSHRRSLLISWFGEHSPINIVKNSKTDLMKANLKGDEADRVWNIDAAKATPFFAMPEADREPEVPTYGSIHEKVTDFIERMLKQADKVADANEKARAKAELNNLRLVATNAPEQQAA